MVMLHVCLLGQNGNVTCALNRSNGNVTCAVIRSKW